MTVSDLKPGARFTLPGLTPLTGTLLLVNECRARVRLDRATGDGQEIQVTRPTCEVDWSPGTEVRPQP